MSEVQKDKSWSISASDGVTIKFTPVFVVNEMAPGEVHMATDKDVECAMIHCEMVKNGETISMDLAFQEIFMFVYYCCNEELRQNLQLRQTKNMTEIPYEVTFKLDKGELEAGMAKRLIKLPVDEITMAIARADSQLMNGKANLQNINEWFRKRTENRKRSNQLLERR